MPVGLAIMSATARSRSHVTRQYNGWTGPNPHGYTTGQQIHSQFEGAFVSANIHCPRCMPKKNDAAPSYRRRYFRRLRRLPTPHRYLRRKGLPTRERREDSWDAGSAESRDFTIERLAAGASMLRDMIYTAWIDSAQPVVPDSYSGK